MDWSLIWAGVGALSAATSVIAAGIAWWRSNYSKTAKKDAEDARDYTRRLVFAIERIADASSSEGGSYSVTRDLGPVGFSFTSNSLREALSLSFVRGSLFRLRNHSDTEVAIEGIENRDRFMRIDLQVGTKIPGGESVDFIIAGSWGRPVPGELALKIAGESEHIRVPIPPKP